MRLFFVMGWIRFKLLCTRFLSHPREVTAGLFAPAVWRVRYALAGSRMVGNPNWMRKRGIWRNEIL